ncbi:MAG: NlpC/P60 family protein [Candidatus Competibacteraceae bacterium]
MKHPIRGTLFILAGILAIMSLGYIAYQFWQKSMLPDSMPVGISPPPVEIMTSSPPASEPALIPPVATPQVAPTPPISPPTPLPRSRDARLAPTIGEMALVFGEWEQGGWTDVFAKPDADSIRLSQALIGDKVKVLEQRKGWSQVEMVSQPGVKGWIKTTHLTKGSASVWRLLNQGNLAVVVRAPGIAFDNTLFVPFGATLPLDSTASASRLVLPDGSRIPLDPADIRPVEKPLTLEEALDRIKGFRQVSYQYGGNTRLAMDSSGLIFLLFRAMGLQVPRTLEGLQKMGTFIPPEQRQTGDIAFFSTFHSDQLQPVILLDKDTFIEASPARGVGLGLIEQLHHHQMLAVHRYIELPYRNH